LHRCVPRRLAEHPSDEIESVENCQEAGPEAGRDPELLRQADGHDGPLQRHTKKKLDRVERFEPSSV